MAYFDSPKNRALWDKELESLDAERERRKEEGYRPGQDTGSRAAGTVRGTASGRYADNPKVRRITLKDLEEIERLASSRMGSSDGSHDRRKIKEAAEKRRNAQKAQEGPAVSG